MGIDGIIGIKVTDESPEKAVAMANAFVGELDKLLRQIAVREAKDRLVFLEKERLQSSKNLTKAEEDLRIFSEKNNVVSIENQARATLEYIAALRAAVDAKDVQIKVMRQQATQYNYDVVRLEIELKGLREKLKASETQWEACAGDFCLPANKTPSLGLEYVRMYREVKLQEALYQLYTKLEELARLDMVKDVSVLQIVDEAKLPERKSGPERALWMIAIGIASIFMMIFIAFLADYVERLKTKEAEAARLSELTDYLGYWTGAWQRTKAFIKRSLLRQK